MKIYRWDFVFDSLSVCISHNQTFNSPHWEFQNKKLILRKTKSEKGNEYP